MQNQAAYVSGVIGVLIGAAMVVGGLFLPVMTCDAPSDAIGQCEEDTLTYLSGEDFEEGLVHVARNSTVPLIIVAAAVVCVVAALRRSGAEASGSILFGLCAFTLWIQYDLMDRLYGSDNLGLEVSFGYGWLVIGIGTLAVLGATASIGRLSRALRDNAALDQPISPWMAFAVIVGLIGVVAFAGANFLPAACTGDMCESETSAMFSFQRFEETEGDEGGEAIRNGILANMPGIYMLIIASSALPLVFVVRGLENAVAVGGFATWAFYQNLSDSFGFEAGSAWTVFGIGLVLMVVAVVLYYVAEMSRADQLPPPGYGPPQY